MASIASLIVKEGPVTDFYNGIDYSAYPFDEPTESSDQKFADFMNQSNSFVERIFERSLL